MPKDIRLFNQAIKAEQGEEQDPDSAPGTMRDCWTIAFIDKTYGDRMMITFTRETRDDLVRQLTDGRVLNGGELPSI